MIRIEAVWLAVEPTDMRAGMESLLARVVAVFGAAQPHQAYCFTNGRANRMKVLVHDGIGIWLACRRLNQGRFVWARPQEAVQTSRKRPGNPPLTAEGDRPRRIKQFRRIGTRYDKLSERFASFIALCAFVIRLAKSSTNSSPLA